MSRFGDDSWQPSSQGLKIGHYWKRCPSCGRPKQSEGYSRVCECGRVYVMPPADLSGHPEHGAQQEVKPGVWMPAQPEASGLQAFSLRRKCKKMGGHFWHPLNAEGYWYCCNCPARERLGLPAGESRRAWFFRQVPEK